MDSVSVSQVVDAAAKILGLERQGLRREKKPPLLSVCMIVKNEERSICDALESVHRAADEIIVLDTGCTDETIERASRFPKVKVFSHPIELIEDFSALRNEAFSYATGRYVMWLDAGDRVSDAQQLRKEVRKEASDVISLKTVFGSSVFWRERVVPRLFARFQHRVHETMVITGLSERRVDSVVVNHKWFDKVGREDSLVRNVRLLKLMLDESPPDQPDRPRWEYYLARELKKLGRLDEALEHYRIRAGQEGFWEDRAKAAIDVALIQQQKKNFLEAIRAGYEAMKLCDGWRDPYYVIGDAYFWLGNYDRAIGWFQHALTIPKPNTTVLSVWEDVYTYLCQCQLSHCYEKLSDSGKALYWAMEELKAAPESQRVRIRARIKKFKGDLDA
jgi:glycosyltransferase involved in cell wall biosynthesis